MTAMIFDRRYCTPHRYRSHIHNVAKSIDVSSTSRFAYVTVTIMNAASVERFLCLR